MFAMNLVDVTDNKTKYGILLCENDDISEEVIQNKIYDIKEQYEREKVDWIIEDVICNIPSEWGVKLQQGYEVIVI